MPTGLEETDTIFKVPTIRVTCQVVSMKPHSKWYKFAAGEQKTGVTGLLQYATGRATDRLPETIKVSAFLPLMPCPPV